MTTRQIKRYTVSELTDAILEAFEFEFLPIMQIDTLLRRLFPHDYYQRWQHPEYRRVLRICKRLVETKQLDYTTTSQRANIYWLRSRVIYHLDFPF